MLILDIKIINAKITGVSLEISTHGAMIFLIYLNYGEHSSGYSGYCLDRINPNTKKVEASEFGILTIRKILETVGVKRWENLQGQYIRVEKPSIDEQITKIGHIIEDKWFDIVKFSDEYEKNLEET